MPDKDDSTLLVIRITKKMKAEIRASARKKGHMTSASFIRALISKAVSEPALPENVPAKLASQALSTNSPMAVTVNDGSGAKYAVVNQPFAEMHGYPAEELTGKSVLFLLLPEEREKAKEQVKALDMKDHFALVTRHVRKDGTSFRALAHFSVFRDKEHGVRYSLMTLQDIGPSSL